MRKSGHNQVVSPHSGFMVVALKLPGSAFAALFFNSSPPPSSSRNRTMSPLEETARAGVFAESQPPAHRFPAIELHGIQLFLQLGPVAQYAIVCLRLVGFWNANNRRPYRPVVIKRFLVDIVEESAQRIKIMLRCWVKFMVVAHRATNG